MSFLYLDGSRQPNLLSRIANLLNGAVHALSLHLYVCLKVNMAIRHRLEGFTSVVLISASYTKTCLRDEKDKLVRNTRRQCIRTNSL